MDYYNDLQKISDKVDVTRGELHTTKAELLEAITLLRIDVAGLKIKSGIWGFAAGIIPAMIFFIMRVFGKE